MNEWMNELRKYALSIIHTKIAGLEFEWKEQLWGIANYVCLFVCFCATKKPLHGEILRIYLI